MIVESIAGFSGRALDCDVCVIGGGAAGITIARELASVRGASTLLLESGGLDLDAQDQLLYAGRNAGLPYFDLMATRLRFFGGTTNHWGGQGCALDPIDFERREWVEHSGWPIDYEEYRRHLPRARRVCEVDDAVETVAELDEATGGTDLVFDSSTITRSTRQYSPPTRFGTRYRAGLQAATNVRVLLKSNVTRIEPFENGNAVRSLEVSGLDGSRFRVRARAYVLAAGGLENPRLLLLSNGLGNRNDLVGRGFMEHPHVSLGDFVPARGDLRLGGFVAEQWRRVPGIRASMHLSPTRALQHAERLPNFVLNLVPRFEGEEETTWLHRLGRGLARRGIIEERTFREYFAFERPIAQIPVSASLEQVPNFASRVTLGEETDALGQRQIVLDWRLTQWEEKVPARIAELLGRELGARGYGRLHVDVAWTDPGGAFAGHHHMGTTRMSESPRDGVVDPNCRVHGVENLFIAGSSVFPSGGATNPTLSIVALSIRLADHLKETLWP